MEAHLHFNNLRKFDMVKNFESFPQQHEISHLHQIPQDAKIQHVEPTRQCEYEPQLQEFEPRSTKKQAQDLGISFQACFMDEHKKCFIKQTQKYVELQKVELLNDAQNQQFLKKSIYLEDQEFVQYDEYSIKQFLKQNCSLLDKNQISRLLIDLKRQDKLEQILSFVINQVQQKYAAQLLSIGNYVMEAYFQIQDDCYTLQQIIQYSQSLIQNFAQKWDQKLSYVNFKGATLQGGKNSNQRFKAFRKYIGFYVLTILLIMAGFFQNPAFQVESNYLKRQLDCDQLLSQDEDQEDLDRAAYRKSVQKKIKF